MPAAWPCFPPHPPLAREAMSMQLQYAGPGDMRLVAGDKNITVAAI
jgi:hypothetical protein